MKPCVLIIVENLPVPLDRRVWQESCALRDAGYQVVVICPQMHDYTKAEEVIDGIQIYRHKIQLEAKGFLGFFSSTRRRFGAKRCWRGRPGADIGLRSFIFATRRICCS